MNPHSPAAPILEALAREGPLTGAELFDATGLERFTLWKTCLDHPDIEWKVVGRRYLRLDRTVEGYGRLSPSIKREFLTYTVLGLKDQSAEVNRRSRSLGEEIRRISREKFLLARVRLRSVVEDVVGSDRCRDGVCFVIAGDIVFDMAHAVPRPEVTTGKMVRGSDLDIVIIARDGIPEADLDVLDKAILREKFHLLTHPTYREEIDYIIKPVSRVERQLKFDTFEHMVACKILDEGKYLLGSRPLFDEVKALVEAAGVPARLRHLEEEALRYRRAGEQKLKASRTEPSLEVLHRYFYTREETPEIY